MAGKSGKKQVQSNLQILSNLYKLTVPTIVLTFLRVWFSSGSLLKCTLSQIPILLCIYTIDKSGRPKFDVNDPRKVVKYGIDLSDTGTLIEYLFDIIYLSLLGNVGVILFDTFKFYWVWILCPVYLAYKGYSLKQQYFPSKPKTKKSHIENEEDTSTTNVKSKRQLKREKNENKNGSQVKYKYR
ncbi:hypothetical protein KAFR_0D00950 [Kazachstania africana CBS 2517]|uniref:Late endosome and vacuole interface protein 10 n=1 Tax=Kazachstania africana (strain ATCC 22294 / BCRC 22015 / CBS 2517 / CECT 1963 / NBRC 1671 / NRRL Y-8276) TaxID=1071382 RepID=H2ATP2_KAZAF|nr:hypothetical protein KAFR_0D00950 [Kazachstania africana CBS 2517]CCF57742.1 hypothetical protein KAFR_0D00950 [Kazachstania africana CBS 2517]